MSVPGDPPPDNYERVRLHRLGLPELLTLAADVLDYLDLTQRERPLIDELRDRAGRLDAP